MLEPGDIELIDDRMVIDGETDELVVWNRLKKELEELSKTPTNKQSTKCQCCGSDDDGHNDLYVLCESCADFV